ncbi:Ribosome small subunit-stimulated GTPase EngC [Clostridiaceae bacterium JG1575]|nr:Ribosome small subunit-stimulated GTPase EngC [Clostridiaceae bacterium JG1575]
MDKPVACGLVPCEEQAKGTLEWGRIVKGVGGLYQVRNERGEESACRLRGKFRRGITPLPGDAVRFTRALPEGIIEEILPRTNALIRPAIANVTEVFLVFAVARPDINWDLLYSFLLGMEQKGVAFRILWNKMDLAGPAQRASIEEHLRGTGYAFTFLQANQEGASQSVLPYIKDGIYVLCGPSGAGKSTLLNALLGQRHMATGEVSQRIGRGRHTTRHTELVPLGAGLLADTPGFSHVEPAGITPGELKEYFPEFRPFEGSCRFQGCLHDKEPGCAVKNASTEVVAPQRYDYYLRVLQKMREEEKHQWD